MWMLYNNKKDEMYGYWLHNIEEIGNKTREKILEEFITERELYQAKISKVEMFLTKQQLLSFEKSRETWNVEKNYETIQQKSIRFLSIRHMDYPEELRTIPDPPMGIYVKGRLPNSKAIRVAVIGARNCSNYGKAVAEEFVGVLASNHIQVISGMAYGIDGISQRQCLKLKSSTFAVLGSGVEVCYPSENLDLYHMILENELCGILSELPPYYKPKPQFFAMRNRIISGLSDVVLVIEAKSKSGTLITVDMALEQGREVFAVPGRVLDALSFGCHKLIDQGAQIAYDPNAFLERLFELFPDKAQYHKKGIVKKMHRKTSDLDRRAQVKNVSQLQILEELELKPLIVEDLYQLLSEKSLCESLSTLFQELLELQLMELIYCNQGLYFLKQ